MPTFRCCGKLVLVWHCCLELSANGMWFVNASSRGFLLCNNQLANFGGTVRFLDILLFTLTLAGGLTGLSSVSLANIIIGETSFDDDSLSVTSWLVTSRLQLATTEFEFCTDVWSWRLPSSSFQSDGKAKVHIDTAPFSATRLGSVLWSDGVGEWSLGDSIESSLSSSCRLLIEPQFEELSSFLSWPIWELLVPFSSTPERL